MGEMKIVFCILLFFGIIAITGQNENKKIVPEKTKIDCKIDSIRVLEDSIKNDIKFINTCLKNKKCR